MNRIDFNLSTEARRLSSPLISAVPSCGLAEDVHDLGRLCARMWSAAERRDVRQTLGLLEAARGLAYVVLAGPEWAKVNKAGFSVEADLDNELWSSAVRSVEFFADVVRIAVQATLRRN